MKPNIKPAPKRPRPQPSLWQKAREYNTARMSDAIADHLRTATRDRANY